MTTIMGLYLSSLVFLKREKPMSVIVLHGIFSIIGFGILLFYYYPAAQKSLFLFTGATVFGVILLYQHLTHKTFTKWFCFAHGILTIAGLVYLADLIWRQ
jgi:hypothetical protein